MTMNHYRSVHLGSLVTHSEGFGEIAWSKHSINIVEVQAHRTQDYVSLRHVILFKALRVI